MAETLGVGSRAGREDLDCGGTTVDRLHLVVPDEQVDGTVTALTDQALGN